jgi:hypothetical protein
VRIYGVDELSDLLRRAAHSLDRKEVVEWMKQEAQPIVEMAKSDALQVNPGRATYKISDRMRGKVTIKPGTISRSIGTKVGRSQHAVVFVVPIITKSYTSGWFAHFPHEGTQSRVKRKGSSTGAITKPVKFMDRAGSQANRDAAANRITARIMAKLQTIGL